MKYDIPSYWNGSVEDIQNLMSTVRRGKVHTLCTTPGGREVYMVEYGTPNELHRKANYSSAMGGSDYHSYADKRGEDYHGCLLVIGAEHGGEFEGTVAVNNLIQMIETGTDFAGNSYPELLKSLEGLHLLLIPCLNMDGRARIPLKAIIGQDYYGFRYYSQGTWKPYTDGEGKTVTGALCEHPNCKRVHPIKEPSDFLGGYFNDDGVNVIHDNFFFPMAEETKAILRLVDTHVPDITLHLHGGGNSKQQFYQFDYMPIRVKKQIAELTEWMTEAHAQAGLSEIYYPRTVEGFENSENHEPSFNLQCACTAISGTPSIVFESNQALDLKPTDRNPGICVAPDDIYRSHRILFETTARYVHTLVERMKTK